MPDKNDLCSWSTLELAAGIREKRVSSVEATEAALARIDQLNPRINAVVTVTAELALGQARKADEAGTSLGRCTGCPTR